MTTEEAGVEDGGTATDGAEEAEAGSSDGGAKDATTD